MFSIGDLALNKATGKFGKVIGYGHRMLDNVYQTTVKVLVTDAVGYMDRIEEDLHSAWNKIEDSVETKVS